MQILFKQITYKMTPLESIYSLFFPPKLDSLHEGRISIGSVTYNVSYSDIRQTERYPSLVDYVKLLLIQFIPIVGTIWAVVKGSIWLSMDRIKYYGELDQFYDIGGEKKMVDTLTGTYERPKFDSPKEDVKRCHIHAVVFILVGLLSFTLYVTLS